MITSRKKFLFITIFAATSLPFFITNVYGMNGDDFFASSDEEETFSQKDVRVKFNEISKTERDGVAVVFQTIMYFLTPDQQTRFELMEGSREALTSEIKTLFYKKPTKKTIIKFIISILNNIDQYCFGGTDSKGHSPVSPKQKK